jgi:hypothetical protein
MGRRGVARQIKLDGDAFPMGVGVRRDAVAWKVACEDRDRVHADPRECLAEAPLKPRREAPHERRLNLRGT